MLHEISQCVGALRKVVYVNIFDLISPQALYFKVWFKK